MTLLLYILRQLTVSTAFAVGALAFVVFPGIAVSAVHRLGGVSLQAVLTYIPLVGVELAPYLVSLGFLLGVVSTFGRLAADNEWVAISMSGIHPFRTLLPGAVLACALGFGTHALLANVSPVWKLEQGNFRTNAVLEAFRNLAPGRSELDLGRFYLGAVSRDGDAFVDVQIFVPQDDGGRDVLVAERAELSIAGDELLVQLYEARTVKADEMLANAEPAVLIDLSTLVKRRSKDPNLAKHRTSPSIRAALGDGQLERERELSYRFEIHRRLAVGGTYLVFLLVGIPTGLWLRSGNQLTGMGFAALYAFTYYILSLRLGKFLALEGLLAPELAAWTTNLLGAAVGLVLLWRVVRR